MPLETIFRPSVQRLEILSSEGCVDPALNPKIPNETLLNIYRRMVEIRAFDERAVKLQRQGRLGTYATVLGQEASQAVPALCLEPSDWMIPTYRGTGAYYARGMKFRHMLLYWAGDDRGACFPEGNRDMTFSITVAGHLTLATGLAWAARLEKKGAVVLAYLGDGASSKGDFHEALTFAGAMNLPVIFIIENNHWAISVPRSEQCAAKTLAQKADGYGVYGLQVDGNDVLAIYQAVRSAIARGRSGGGASVLEIETYRMGHHTTADDSSRYRSQEDLNAWALKDPIARLRRYLETLKIWDEARQNQLIENAANLVEEEVKAYEAFPEPNPLDMFAHNYAVAPWPLIEQRAELSALIEKKTRAGEAPDWAPIEGRFP